MTKTLDRLIELVCSRINANAVCSVCRDRSKCNVCWLADPGNPIQKPSILLSELAAEASAVKVEPTIGN